MVQKRTQERKTLAERQQLLIETNIALLQQALDDRTYADAHPAAGPHRDGTHLCHILEFHECFFDGLASSHLDYDARRRDESTQRSRRVAGTRIASYIDRFVCDGQLRGDQMIWVRMEDAPVGEGFDTYLNSSLARELQMLASHTVHHFALIALTLRAQGVETSASFGMAPSTMRYKEAGRAMAAQDEKRFEGNAARAVDPIHQGLF